MGTYRVIGTSGFVYVGSQEEDLKKVLSKCSPDARIELSDCLIMSPQDENLNDYLFVSLEKVFKNYAEMPGDVKQDIPLRVGNIESYVSLPSTEAKN